MHSIWIGVLGGLLTCVSPARAAVVINEIFYHAPEELDDIQWIELYNTADQPVKLAGWHFDDSVGFTFPQGTTLDAGGYIVVARNPAHFKQLYGVNTLGPMQKPLSRSGGKLELLGADGKRVDRASTKTILPGPLRLMVIPPRSSGYRPMPRAN